MANSRITKIKVNNTTYDLHDAESRRWYNCTMENTSFNTTFKNACGVRPNAMMPGLLQFIYNSYWYNVWIRASASVSKAYFTPTEYIETQVTNGKLQIKVSTGTISNTQVTVMESL